MTKEKLILAIDLGTYGMKVALITVSGKIIGAQLMCAEASCLVNEVSLAISKGLAAEDIAQLIHPHPTLGEGIAEAAEMVLGAGIHTMPKRR